MPADPVQPGASSGSPAPQARRGGRGGRGLPPVPPRRPPAAEGATGPQGTALLTYSTRLVRPRVDTVGRVKHVALLIACAVSLLAGAAALVGWWAGCSRELHFRWVDRGQYDELIVSRGQFLVQEVWEWRPALSPGRSRFEKKVVRPPTDLVEDFNWAEAPWAFAGFAVGHSVVADVVLVVPFWFVLLGSMALPVWAAARRARRKQNGRGPVPVGRTL